VTGLGMYVPDVWRDYRRGANAVEAALIDLQGQHGLTDLEMITVLEDYQRTLLGHMLKKQHARKSSRAAS
jgi:hypothetical protein